jgi:hypothetical protein
LLLYQSSERKFRIITIIIAGLMDASLEIDAETRETAEK